jgi:hypothetical protein
MKWKFEIIFTTLLILSLYLFLSIFIDLSMPNWYVKWSNEINENARKRDPLTNVGEMFLKVAEQRDSLQKIVDNCKCN